MLQRQPINNRLVFCHSSASSLYITAIPLRSRTALFFGENIQTNVVLWNHSILKLCTKYRWKHKVRLSFCDPKKVHKLHSIQTQALENVSEIQDAGTNFPQGSNILCWYSLPCFEYNRLNGILVKTDMEVIVSIIWNTKDLQLAIENLMMQFFRNSEMIWKAWLFKAIDIFRHERITENMAPIW